MIFDDIDRLLDAHPNHTELARMLGVHLSTLQRWQRRTMTPNPDHVVKINHLLGQLDQGQLFFNAPKMSQQEAIERFGAPPIPGLLISSASPKADEFRIRQYGTLIEPDGVNTPCSFHIAADDLAANSFTVYGTHIAQPNKGDTIAQRGDVLLAHAPDGTWRVAVAHPSRTPASCNPDAVLVLRPKKLNGHVLARLILHPVVKQQVMPFSTPGQFSSLFKDRLLDAVLPIHKDQLSHLNDWGARLSAAMDEVQILGKAIEREIDKATDDWQQRWPLG